jgi:hypothetical protein
MLTYSPSLFILLLPLLLCLFFFKFADLWSFLESYRGSSTIHFLRAGKNKGWVPEIVNRFETIEARSNGKVRLHTMPHVGHWLHVEDMKGMLDMIVTNSSKMM